MREAMEVFAGILGAIAGLAIAVWGLWCTWVAFAGGTFPIPFVVWESPGDFWLGLLFLFVVTPILTGIASQIFVWIFGIFFFIVGILSPESRSSAQ